MPLLSFKRVLDRVSRVFRLDRASGLFFFAVGLVLRGIPELLITPYPIGYETITSYAPIMTTFHSKTLMDVAIETFGAGPLFYVLMWVASTVSGAHAFLLLKVTGPVLYGCLAVAFFVFLRRGLKLEWKMAFLATLILAFQPIALRESWDRFRTVLGLTFLFITLIALKGNSRFRWLLMAIFGVLTVLSREYVAVVLFAAVLGYAILERKDRVKSIVTLVPALGIFAVMVYPAQLWWNYLSPDNPFATGSYSWMVQDVLSIFAVGYLLLLPFVVKGFWRDTLLDSMVGWLLLGSFSVVVIPWFAVPGYQRWLMLLVFPFTVYAVRGFRRFRLFSENRMRILKVIVLVFIVVGVGYSTGVFSYVGMLPNSYVAVNLPQSSIAWSQVDDVKGVLGWLDENAVANSCVLAEERFYGWTLIYLDRANVDVWVLPYGAACSPTLTLSEALRDGYSSIYLVWFAERAVSGFELVYSWDAVSVFQYSSGV